MSTLRGKLWAKITAMLLLFLCLISLAVSVVGVVVLAQNNAYFDDGTALRGTVLDSGMYYYTGKLYQYINAIAEPQVYYFDEANYNRTFSKENCNVFFTVTDENGNVVLENYKATDMQRTFEYTDEHEIVNPDFDYTNTESAYYSYVTYTVKGGVRAELTAKDRIYYYVTYTDILINARYILAASVCILPLLMLVLVIFLVCAAGHHAEEPYLRRNLIDRIPLDLYIGILLGGAFLAAYILWELTYHDGIEWIVLFVLAIPMGLSLLLTIATRIKTRTLFKNTLVWYIIRGIGIAFRGLWRVIRKIPLYWKTALIWTGLSLSQLFLFVLFDNADYMPFWFIEKLIITPILIWSVINLQTLRIAGREIAGGNTTYTVSTAGMLPAFREHAEHLNGIGEGMQVALEESLQAERMRVELITNVSHDIKTPLTSIINYVDLLKRDGLESENAAGYLDVIDRQSARLKKLTEDLVEVSKATTGHIRVEKSQLDVVILLQQAIAEYADRLSAKALTPVFRCDPPNAYIHADGRLLWRVFDNLLSNIAKYAKEDTRVYITAQAFHGKVMVTFKNISSAPLDLTPSELTERFVRGDRSRHTDGSGLGLSIAKTLVELQDGVFELAIDGDLFKTAIVFDALTSH